MPVFENDLSQGRVITQLIRFSLPFILSNLIQSLYSMADMVIVGRLCGAISMSGVSIGTQVTMLITNMVIGLSVGGTVLIAQYKGSGAREKFKSTIGTLFTTLAILAVVLTSLMVFLRAPLLRLILTPEESFSEANNYLLITALGTIFIFGYNAFSAIMRGMGDSRHPFMFVCVACVTNIVLDILLVGPFQMRAAGAAIATIVSQALSMFLCAFYLRRHNFVFDFSLSSFRIDPGQLKKLLQLGIPTSIQNVITGLSFLFLTAMVNTISYNASAAVGAVGKFNAFAILPAIAVSASISSMCAQNIGAGREDRAIQTLWVGIVFAELLSFTMFLIATFFPVQIMEIFKAGETVTADGVAYLKSFRFDYLFAPLMFCFNGLFIGSGHTGYSLFIGMLSAVLVRAPVGFLFGLAMDWGLLGVGLGAPIASIVATLVAVILFFRGKWRHPAVLAPDSSPNKDIIQQ